MPRTRRAGASRVVLCHAAGAARARETRILEGGRAARPPSLALIARRSFPLASGGRGAGLIPDGDHTSARETPPADERAASPHPRPFRVARLSRPSPETLSAPAPREPAPYRTRRDDGDHRPGDARRGRRAPCGPRPRPRAQAHGASPGRAPRVPCCARLEPTATRSPSRRGVDRRSRDDQTLTRTTPPSLLALTPPNLPPSLPVRRHPCVPRVAASSDKAVAAAVSAAECELDNFQRVSVLAEALPYLQRFAGQTIVVKYGGAAMTNEGLKDRVIKDLVLLSTVGIRPILVHGGGPEINQWLAKVGIEPVFKKGLRVTDADTMEIVEMVLVGKVNKSLVSLINTAGGRAVGVCGKDGNTLRGKVRDPEWGFVGDVTSVDTSVLQQLVDSGHVPVVATVAMDETGQALNVNADTAAGELAASLGAAKLILMTDVPGVCTDKDDPSSLIRTLSIAETRELVKDDVIAGGMIPKVECCVKSIAQGVKSAHIIDGRAPHSLLLEILTDEGAGTMITG